MWALYLGDAITCAGTKLESWTKGSDKLLLHVITMPLCLVCGWRCWRCTWLSTVARNLKHPNSCSAETNPVTPKTNASLGRFRGIIVRSRSKIRRHTLRQNEGEELLSAIHGGRRTCVNERKNFTSRLTDSIICRLTLGEDNNQPIIDFVWKRAVDTKAPPLYEISARSQPQRPAFTVVMGQFIEALTRHHFSAMNEK